MCWSSPGSHAGGEALICSAELTWAVLVSAAGCAGAGRGVSLFNRTYKGVQWTLNTEQVGGSIPRHACSGASILTQLRGARELQENTPVVRFPAGLLEKIHMPQ